MLFQAARSYFSMRSPSCTRSSTMSPRSQTIKRPYYDTLLENNSHLILSPRSDDCDNNKIFIGNPNFPCVQPLSEVKPPNIDIRMNQQNQSERSSTEHDKPICSIKLVRRYVEEDDAASVITSEEGKKNLKIKIVSK